MRWQKPKVLKYAAGYNEAQRLVYLMFAVAERRQIWVERRQERARYTVLGEGSFWLPYYIYFVPKRKCNDPEAYFQVSFLSFVRVKNFRFGRRAEGN